MKIVCSKFDCYTDYNKCKDCPYKLKSVFTKESEQKIQVARAEAEQKIQKIREEIYSMEQTLLKQIPYVSCYHALNADDLKFNVAVFKDDCIPQKEQVVIETGEVFNKEQKNIPPPQKEQVVIKTGGVFEFEVYDRVILTEI